MATPSGNAILAALYSNLGYHEGNNNYNIFASYVGVPNNQAWCTTFVSWGFKTAGFQSLCLMSDYSVDQLNWFSSRNRLSYYPAVGAVCWLGPGGGDHTAFVYKYDADNIYTIEGNWDDQVQLMVRPRRTSGPGGISPYAYGLPNYTEGILTADPSHPVSGSTYAATGSLVVPGATPPPSGGGPTPSLYNPYPDGTLPTPNSSVPSAKGLQTLLIHAHYLATGTTLTDLYNTATQTAVNNFYTAHPEKFTPDTFIGPLGLAQLILDAQAADNYTPGPGGATYTVATGDTLSSIAVALGVTLDVLVTANPQLITVGTVLNNPATVTGAPTDYTVFPGASFFGTGQSNGYILQLATWLKARGGSNTPGVAWTNAIATDMTAFQVAQGWSGADADGIPGDTSWGYLKTGTGNSIPAGGGGGGGATPGVWTTSVAINNKTGVSYAKYTAGGTVASWIAAACAARGITGSTAIAAWTTGYQTAISRESSGDANACNRNDSNNVTPAGFSQVADYGYGYPGGWLLGALTNYQCSRGCAQCIPQTFASNHCPGTSTMIYDPVANIAASMGYVRAQYGVSFDGHDLASKVQQFDPNRSPAGY